jgi:environmental stress-induced protein Ves
MARLIPHASLRAVPWKNGGGSTTEIAIEPAGAGFDDFDWRVSLATIAQSGPFSVFPGIDRTLALVDGAGVVLQIDGAHRFDLCAATPMIAFAGEAAVHASVLDGATTDFNVMTRRARCSHTFARIAVDGVHALRHAGTLLLFLADGETLLACRGAERHALAHHDALVLDDGAGWTLEAGRASVFVVALMTNADPETTQ